jgi:hypothetical protein
MGTSLSLLTDFEQRNTPPTLRHPSPSHTFSILPNNLFNILSLGSVLLQSTHGYIHFEIYSLLVFKIKCSHSATCDINSTNLLRTSVI